MTARSTKQRCGDCTQAKVLIQSLAGTQAQPMPLPELMANMTALLYVAMSLLFSEFDYEAKKESNTAIAIRVLATAAERLSHTHAGAARMRSSWLRSMRHTPLARVTLRETPAEPCGSTRSTRAGSQRGRPRQG